ncbi:MAG TPA: zinc-binding dehydrogenase, partial [Sphingomonas sp.]|nr:zinc-binding dehydrogenase [Sphingomonas sp.]
YPHAPLDRESARGLTQALKDLAGPGGIQLVLDPVGGDYAEPAFRALAWEGRYLVVGFPAGIPRLPLNYVLFKSCDVRGVFWGEFAEREPARNRANVDQLLRWWEEGRIRPRIARRWPLARGGEAIEWLAGRGAIGKAVVEMDAPSPA